MDVSLPKTSQCHCSDIHWWGIQQQASLVNWDELSRHAQLLRNRKQGQWSMSAQRLLDSARAGCQTCVLLVKAIETYEPNVEDIEEIHLRLATLVPQLSVTFRTKVKQITRKNTHKKVEDNITGLWISHPDGYQGYEPFGAGVLKPPQQPRSTSLASNIDQSVHAIQEWTMECLNSHETCHRKPDFCPRRLVDVGTGSVDMNRDTVRLVETATKACRPPYIALSHCWGKTKQAVTNKANYQQRLLSIPVRELSRTFRDALWLTRRLGFSYIWIDSLCIIQDDSDDWEREALKMAQLYASAYVTIAAAHGSDGEAGVFYQSQTGHSRLDLLLRDQNGKPQITSLTLLPWSKPDGESPVHQMYSTENDPILQSAKSRNYNVDALLGRGWAFQERILSTRIIHFSQEELVWECKTRRACECGHLNDKVVLNSFMGLLRDDDSDEEMTEYSNNDNESRSSTDSDEILDDVVPGNTSSQEAWYNMVEQFTARDLTKPDDRGPAFAGIARSFGSHKFNYDDEDLGQYCAGMWLNHLPWSLFWSCSMEKFPEFNGLGRRMKKSMAPSWSWYSTSGKCSFITSKYKKSDLYLKAVTEEVEVEYEFDSVAGTPFGRLRRGAITIEGLGITRATRTSDSGNFSLILKSSPSLSDVCSIELFADDPEDARYVGDIACLYMYHASHEMLLEREHSRIPLSDEDFDTIYFDEYVDYPDTIKCDEHFVGLALVAIDQEPNTYRRIGIFHAVGAACKGLKEFDISNWHNPKSKNPYRALKRKDIPVPSGAQLHWGKSIEFENKIILI